MLYGLFIAVVQFSIIIAASSEAAPSDRASRDVAAVAVRRRSRGARDDDDSTLDTDTVPHAPLLQGRAG